MTTADMEVDAAGAGAGSSTGVAPASTSSSSSRLSFSLLQQVRLSQAQNGLKHGDYARYRTYCTRRLRSLAKTLRFLHGKGRYAPKKLDPSLVAAANGGRGDARYLQIPLVLSERAWALAMELKREVEAGAAGGAAARKRQHALGRAAKAARWAGQLASLAAAVGDTRTALEAEAYAAYVEGGYLLDRERDWAAALASFQKARRLLQELARVGGDLDAQAAASALAEECDPPLRYCRYQLDRAADGGGSAAAAALETQSSAGGGNNNNNDLLSQKLAALAQEAAREQAAQKAAAEAAAKAAGGAGAAAAAAAAAAAPPTSVEWRGQAFIVRPERARVALAAAAAAAAEAEAAEEAATAATTTTDDKATDGVLAAHDRALNAYAEARAVVRGLARAAAAGAGGGGDKASSSAAAASSAATTQADADELAALEQAVSGLVLERQLLRGQLAARSAGQRLHAALKARAEGRGVVSGGGAAASSSTTTTATALAAFERGAKPEDLVRTYDALSHAAAELSELSSSSTAGPGALAGRAAEALVDAAAARGSSYAAWRCYYMAHAYLSAAAAAGAAAATTTTDDAQQQQQQLRVAGAKAAEAAALFRRARERAADAAEKLGDLPKGEAAARALLPGVVAEGADSATSLPALAEAWEVVAAAEAAAADAAANEAAERAVGGLALEGSGGAASTADASTATLADPAARSSAWESFAGAGGVAAASATGGGRASRAAAAHAAPPRIFPLACPIAPPLCPARPVMLDTAGGALNGYPDVAPRCGSKRASQAKGAAAASGGGGAAATGAEASPGGSGGGAAASTLGWAASKLLGAWGGGGGAAQ